MSHLAAKAALLQITFPQLDPPSVYHFHYEVVHFYVTWTLPTKKSGRNTKKFKDLILLMPRLLIMLMNMKINGNPNCVGLFPWKCYKIINIPVMFEKNDKKGNLKERI